MVIETSQQVRAGTGTSKSAAEMVGEAMRALGVLSFVAIPLDRLIADKSAVPLWGAMVAAVGFGLAFFIVGVMIEGARK